MMLYIIGRQALLKKKTKNNLLFRGSRRQQQTRHAPPLCFDAKTKMKAGGATTRGRSPHERQARVIMSGAGQVYNPREEAVHGQGMGDILQLVLFAPPLTEGPRRRTKTSSVLEWDWR